MVHRRDFIKKSAVAAGAVTLGTPAVPAFLRGGSYPSRRPPLRERRFVSEAVEETLRRVSRDIADPELRWMFNNCFPNTLDTTVFYKEEGGLPDTFVITGDIHAMWLRDSSAQVWPYVALAGGDPSLRKLLEGVIRRQTRCILIDPYANAFNDGPTGSEWEKDLTAMKPELHERKWEVDSLCYPIRLAHGYWKSTGHDAFMDDAWRPAMRSVIRTFREQQRKDGPGPYTFMRVTARQTDTVAGMGYGNPWRPNGMICSVFRPSDDATIFLGLVPSNFFAVKALRQMAEMAGHAGDSGLAGDALALAAEVEKALRQYAVVDHLHYGKVYPFEVDGYGNALFMDDGNIPSLLAMPYLGTVASDDPVYRNTRRFLLSGDNPWFFRGKAAEGIGSPHTGRDMIWPLALLARTLTSDNEEEILQNLRWLVRSNAGTGFMHESFHKDDPSRFTRKWFAWANTLFGELILKLHAEHPALLQKSMSEIQ